RSVYRAEEPELPIRQIIFDPFASPFGPLREMWAPAAEPARGASPVDGVMPPAPVDAARGNGAARGRDGAARWPVDFRNAAADFERETLEEALEHSKYKQTVAARLLGLSYHQLRGLLKKHGLKASRDDPSD